MSVLDRARNDWRRLSQEGWGVDITFTTPDGLTSVVVKGIAAKIHLRVEQETEEYYNGKHAHITVSESLLTEQNYPLRDAADDDVVDLENHTVGYTDSAGFFKSYVIRESHIDETLGLLRLILGSYSPT